MPKVKDKTNAKRQRDFQARRKERNQVVDEVFKEAIAAEGGVQWTLDAVDYQPDTVNPLASGLKITWHLSEQVRETLMEWAANERGLTFDAFLRELDARLLVWLIQLGVIQHDYRLKEETDGS